MSVQEPPPAQVDVSDQRLLGPFEAGQLASLFEPLELSPGVRLRNRIVLAPCTRNRATADLSPTPGAAGHYARRADAGLLITEATLISAGVQGFIDTPGIFLPSHVAAWATVAEAVHRRDGRIFLQLWHPGRMTHSHFAGMSPRAPSAVFDPGRRRQTRGLKLFHEAPLAMTHREIQAAIQAYRQAGLNAVEAGFDGVEIHGANGYLPEQFWRHHTNRRMDEWGGSARNRARFTLEVVRELADAIGAERVALRLSPAAYFSEMKYTEGDNEALEVILDSLKPVPIAYVHTGIVTDTPYEYLDGTSTDYLRRRWPGVLMGNGGYSPVEAARFVSEGTCELVAFGKLFLANPDLVDRLRRGDRLKAYSRAVLEDLE